MRASRRVGAGVAVFAGIALASCGSSTKTITENPKAALPAPTKTTTVAARPAPLTRQQAGQRYLAVVKRSNQATETWDAVLRASPSPLAAAAAADTLAQALANADTQFLRLARDYPLITGDVNALVNADALVEGTLRSLVARTPDTLPNWTQQMATNNAKAEVAAQKVRLDLGLPPA